MPRKVRLAPVQPPIAPGRFEETDNTALLAASLSLLDAAGSDGADIAGFPELLNIFGMSYEAGHAAASPECVAKLVAEVATIAKRHAMYVWLPLLEERRGKFFNTVKLLDRAGRLLGAYDKTHLTDQEREHWHVTAGSEYPVFDLDFGRLGVMVCQDVDYPEVARALALAGAEVILLPSWQRGPSELVREVQFRARAVDNFVWVARSSYGFEPGVAWTPGMMLGRSCVVAPDGLVVSDAGRYSGYALAQVDLDLPNLVDVQYDGGVYDRRRMILSGRRPETYGLLTSTVPSPDDLAPERGDI